MGSIPVAGAKNRRKLVASGGFLSGSPRSRQTSWGDCRGPQEVVRLLGVIVGVPDKSSDL